MAASFDWWLLILGLVVGGGLTWLFLADLARRDDDLAADEMAREAAGIAAEADGPARGISPEAVAEVLARHRAYLRGQAHDLDALDDEAAIAAAREREASGG